METKLQTIPTYEGWPNKPTWAVMLWIKNEQATYEYWLENIRTWQENASNDQNVRDNIWTVEQAAKYRVAEHLRDEIEGGAPTNDDASMYSDLMNWALAYVEWDAIAEALLRDVNES